MKMNRIEKWFVNRPQRAKQAIGRAERLLHFTDIEGKQNYLEVGCGNGAVSRYFAVKYLLDVTGIDVDPDQIKSAQNSIQGLPNVRFFEADATNLPFPDKNFDIVLSFFVMHHISNWLDALKEIHRVLKPGGYFVYSDLLYAKLPAKVASLFRDKYGVTRLEDLNSFAENSSYSTVHSELSRRHMLLWDYYEAVYQKTGL